MSCEKLTYNVINRINICTGVLENSSYLHMDSNAWRTPRALRRWLLDYAERNAIEIIGDACASDKNYFDGVRYYYTEEDDAMQHNWSKAEWAREIPDWQPRGSINVTHYWVMNHPYSVDSHGHSPKAWFAKAYNQALKGIGVFVITKAPCGEQNRWGKYVFGKAMVVYNVESKVKYGHPDTGKEEKSAKFGTWVVVYNPKLLSCQDGAPFDTVIKPLYLYER